MPQNECGTAVCCPPFVKSCSGPPLGPAMLRGAAEARGHNVDVLDLAVAEVLHTESRDDARAAQVRTNALIS